MDLKDLLKAFAKELAPLVAAEMESARKAEQPPQKLKEAAKLTGKSESHLRNEVKAGRIKRVPGTSKILIPWAEIERIRAGEFATS